jgi:hypothetical protein
MRLQERLVNNTILLVCKIVGGATMGLAQHGQECDPLGFLKRALTEAGATALTSEQETQLNTLITNFRNAQPTAPDEALKAARTAYNDAILAGDLATAQAQVAIISSRTVALASARLQATATYLIDVLAVLKSGGQLDQLRQKLGDERLVGLMLLWREVLRLEAEGQGSGWEAGPDSRLGSGRVELAGIDLSNVHPTEVEVGKTAIHH